jgi:prepilin-type N-terminal cleavage/methylation domain-containing protein
MGPLRSPKPVIAFVGCYKMAACSRVFRLSSPSGFTLVEMIGVLAILAILASFIAPNIIHQLKAAKQAAEDDQLATIAQGVEVFVRQTRAFPSSLVELSPEYVPVALGQLTANANGFLRYYIVHPNISGYTNATGLSTVALADARYLLITHLQRDENPSITNATEFDNWWNTDETGSPDLKIYRGHLAHLFQLLSLSGSGLGGSYAIDGASTDSGGGALAPHIRYHLTGTTIALDEANNFTLPEMQFPMTTEAGYQFDPDCAAGSKWRIISSGCYSP